MDQSWDSVHRAASDAIIRGGAEIDFAGRRALPRRNARDVNDMSSSPPCAQATLRSHAGTQNTCKDLLTPGLILWRDNHAWCTLCRILWMLLEERGFPYKVEKVSLQSYGEKRRDFLQPDLSPNGTMPVVELGADLRNKSATNSRVLLGSASASTDAMLVGLDELICSSDGRDRLDKPSSGAGEHFMSIAELTDSDRERTESLLQLRGVLWSRDQEWLREFGAWKGKGKGKGPLEKTSEIERMTRDRFFVAMDWVEGELAANSSGPWFFGQRMSVADLAFPSVLERAYATGFYWKGEMLWNRGMWPCIQQWLSALGERATYLACCSDMHTHAHIHQCLGRWGACFPTRGCNEHGRVGEEARGAVDAHRLFILNSTSARVMFTNPPEIAAMPWLAAQYTDSRKPHDALECAYAFSKFGPLVVRAARRAVAFYLSVKLNYEISLEDLGRLQENATSAYVAVAIALVPFGTSIRFSADVLKQGLESNVGQATLLVSPLSRLLVATMFRFTADRISVPRDMGCGAAFLLRGALAFAAGLLHEGCRSDPSASTSEKLPFGHDLVIPIPTRGRYDQDPAQFYEDSDEVWTRRAHDHGDWAFC